MIDLDSSYLRCEQIARASHSNFYRSFAFLGWHRRRAMMALYAFARLADDATDAAPNPSASWCVNDWHLWIDRLTDASRPGPREANLPTELSSVRPALADAVQRFSIPINMLHEIVRGVDMDMTPTEYRSWDALRQYCFRVASAVGICCTAIWSSGPPRATDDLTWQAAVDCGLAFQLTNILRDLREDAQRGRLYLPTDDLARFGIDRAEALKFLSAHPASALPSTGGWNGLLTVQCERAKALFNRGWAVSRSLEPDGRRMFSLMWHTYRNLLAQIERDPVAVFRQRQRLSFGSRSSLIAQHLFTPWFSKVIKAREQCAPAKLFSSNLRSNAEDYEQLTAPKLHAQSMRVAVIGGGLAGINAALDLARHGCQVTLFEAKSRLGGRAGSFHDVPTGAAIDYCQHVGMKCCTQLRRWIAKTDQQDSWKTQEELHFVSRTGVPITVRAWPLPAPLHLSGLLLAWPDLTFLDRLRVSYGLMRLLGTHSSAEFDRTPALDWLRANHQSPNAIENYWSTILVSALGEQIQRVAMGPVRKVLIDGFAATRDAYHLMVPQRPLSELIDRKSQAALNGFGVEIACSTSIGAICDEPSGQWSVRRTGDPSRGELPIAGHDDPFDALIVAIPWQRIPSLLDHHFNLPNLNDTTQQNTTQQNAVVSRDGSSATTEGAWRFSIAQCASQLTSSPITGVHTWWDRPWLERPHAIIIDHLCQWVFPGPALDTELDRSQLESPEEYYYQVVISGSRDLPRGDSSAVLETVRMDLESLFPKARQAKLLRGRVVTDPNSVFSVTPGHESSRMEQETAKPGLYLAGDWTATGWPATMEGALRSGALAAEGVLRYLRRPASLIDDSRPGKF